MKNKYIQFILAGICLAMLSCEENPDYFDVSKAPAVITFEGYPAYTATFATTDDISIPVQAPDAGDIVVEREVTYAVGSESMTIREQLTTLSGPEATLDTDWNTLLETPENVGISAISAVTLIFTTTVDGQSTFRNFDLDFASPFLEVAAPEFAAFDSTINITYSISTSQTPIQKVDIFTSIAGEDFGTVPVQTIEIGSTSVTDTTVTLDFPDETQIMADTAFAVQLIATAANGNTATEVVEITAANLALETEGEFTLRTAGFETEPGVLDTLNQAFDFSQDKVLNSATINTYPDSADVLLQANDGLLTGESLSLVAGGQTSFVVAEAGFSFENASYESVRDAFAAGTAVTEIENISELPTQQVVLVRLGDVADNNAAQFAVMMVSEVVRGFNIEQSEVIITYRSR